MQEELAFCDQGPKLEKIFGRRIPLQTEPKFPPQKNAESTQPAGKKLRNPKLPGVNF